MAEFKTATTAKSKTDVWESNLLDLSIRNSLLNMRLGLKLTPIPVADLGSLEDVLADGKALQIRPRPEDVFAPEKLTFESLENILWDRSELASEFAQKRLRTYLSEKTYEKTIGSLYKKATLAIEETGSNTLFLALGALQWKRTEKDTPKLAPLVMLPVNIIRKSAKQGFALEARDEEAQINITLLELLKQEYRIEVEGLDPLPEDDHGIDLPLILDTFRKSVAHMKDWSIKEIACLGLFSFSQFVMWKDIKEHSAKLSQSKVVDSLIKGHLTWSPEPMEMASEIDPYDTLLPIEADASQLYAIKKASEGKSFVLHGPPGTGKSQTITGIIANALMHEQRVLFVAEKSAALNVVYDRLEKLGLGPFCLELHSNKSTKSHVLDQLQRASDESSGIRDADYDRHLQRNKKLSAELDAYARALFRVQPVGLTLRDLVNRYVECGDIAESMPLDTELVEGLYSVNTLEERFELADKMLAAVYDIGRPTEHPLKAVKAKVNVYDMERNLPDLLARYVRALEDVEEEYQLPWRMPSSSAINEQTVADVVAQGSNWSNKMIEALCGRDDEEVFESDVSDYATALERLEKAYARPLATDNGIGSLDDEDAFDAAATREYAYLDNLEQVLASQGAITPEDNVQTLSSSYREGLSRLKVALGSKPTATESGLQIDEGEKGPYSAAAELLDAWAELPSEWIAAENLEHLVQDIRLLSRANQALQEAEKESLCSIDTANSLDPDALLSEWEQAKNAGLFKKKKAIAAYLEKISSYSRKTLGEAGVISFISQVRTMREKGAKFETLLTPLSSALYDFRRLDGHDWDAIGKMAVRAESCIRQTTTTLAAKGINEGLFNGMRKALSEDKSLPSRIRRDLDAYSVWNADKAEARKHAENAQSALANALRNERIEASNDVLAKSRALAQTIERRHAHVLENARNASDRVEPYIDVRMPAVALNVNAFNLEQWSTTIEDEKEACKELPSNLGAAREWITWRMLADTAQGTHLGPVITAFDIFEDPGLVPAAYKKAVYRLLCEAAISSDMSAYQFNGSVFDKTIQHYKEADEALRENAIGRLRWTLSKRVPDLTERAKNGSEAAYLKRAIRSKGRGVTIRRLFKEAPNMVNSLCPCMLMSPLSVAQYIDLGNAPFDLVVFDEASQIMTCKAVGALARGKNAIVVGDPKQMPPTSFFRATIAEDDFDDTADLESILEDCLSLDMPETYLQWHYRSKHEGLIAFSNATFYEGKLCTFPSADAEAASVTLHKVEGFYDGAGTNDAEARAIVAEVKRRFADPALRDKSVGIVTFSAKQQALVDDYLEQAYYDNPRLERWALQGEEPLFVKNLENVQGDERDVILFSVAYGPDSLGRFRMNFGPLNNEGGWRRLNVAITRSRYEMKVFTIINPPEMADEKITSRGVRALKAFLQYANRGMLDSETAASEELSADAIAEEISKRLEALGYATVQNVGMSSYKVDVAVMDPSDPRRYLAGILLDGASYGRAKTTRDREIARATMLKLLGWNLAQVWTMDWWSRRDRVMESLEDYLLTLAEAAVAAHEAQSEAQAPITLESDLYTPVTLDTAQWDEPVRDDATQTEWAPPVTREPLRQIYVEAKVPFTPIGFAEYKLSQHDGSIRSRFTKIIEGEAPIQLKALCNKVRASFGIARSGADIQYRNESILASVPHQESTFNDMVFVWGEDQDPQSWVGYRTATADGEIRAADEIPYEELRSALQDVLETQGAMLASALPRQMAFAFGYKRIASRILTVMTKAIEKAEDEGCIIVDDDGRAHWQNKQAAKTVVKNEPEIEWPQNATMVQESFGFEPQQATESDDTPEDPDEIAAALQQAGYECIDKREAGGCLWVVGDEAEGERIEEIAGMPFSFKRYGGRATNYRDAWWISAGEND